MPPRGKTKTRSPASSAKRPSAPAPREESIVETVRGLAEILAEHGLSEVVVDLPDATLTLRRGSTSVAMPVAAAPVVAAPVAAAPAHAAHAAATPAPVVDDKAHVVTSPFVGTFYRKPNPDASMYVQLGDKVAKGQVLCIVEAMKLMNEIEADVAGTIVGILGEDGSVVEYGQPLFKIAT